MDAGELVRLRCDVSIPWFKSHIALNDSHRTFARVCVLAECGLEAVFAHMHQPFSHGLNLAASYYITLSVIIANCCPRIVI